MEYSQIAHNLTKIIMMNNNIFSSDNITNVLKVTDANSTDPLNKTVGTPDSLRPEANINLENLILSILSYSIETLSLIGCLAIFFIFAFNARSRSFSFKLILVLAIILFLLALLNVVESFTYGTLCIDLGYIREMFTLSTLTWLVVISWYMLKAAQNKLEENQVFLRFYIYMAVVLPVIIISLGPKSYGDSAGICWITGTDYYNGLINQTILLYAPFLISICFTIAFLIFTLRIIKNLDIEEEQYKNIVSRFAYFPILLGITFLANGLYLYFSLATNNTNVILRVVETIFGRSQGLILACYQYIIKKSDFIALYNILFGNCLPKRTARNRSFASRSFFSKFMVHSQLGFATFIGEDPESDLGNEEYINYE